MREPVRLHADNQCGSDRSLDHVKDRRIDRIPAGWRPKICCAAKGNPAGRRSQIFRNQKGAHDQFGVLYRDRRILDCKLHFFPRHTDASQWEHDKYREQRVPLSLCIALEVGKQVLAFALKLDVVRLMRFERRKHHEAQRASGFEDRAMPGVLRQKGPLAFPPGPLPDTWTRGVREETDFHAAVY